jgi:hypothetical protein
MLPQSSLLLRRLLLLLPLPLLHFGNCSLPCNLQRCTLFCLLCFDGMNIMLRCYELLLQLLLYLQ